MNINPLMQGRGGGSEKIIIPKVSARLYSDRNYAVGCALIELEGRKTVVCGPHNATNFFVEWLDENRARIEQITVPSAGATYTAPDNAMYVQLAASSNKAGAYEYGGNVEIK